MSLEEMLIVHGENVNDIPVAHLQAQAARAAQITRQSNVHYKPDCKAVYI